MRQFNQSSIFSIIMSSSASSSSNKWTGTTKCSPHKACKAQTRPKTTTTNVSTSHTVVMLATWCCICIGQLSSVVCRLLSIICYMLSVICCVLAGVCVCVCVVYAVVVVVVIVVVGKLAHNQLTVTSPRCCANSIVSCHLTLGRPASFVQPVSAGLGSNLARSSPPRSLFSAISPIKSHSLISGWVQLANQLT